MQDGQNLKKNSTIGTSSMGSLDLSADEICRIIKACKGSGIAELKFASLSLSFIQSQRNEIAATPRQESDPPSVPDGITDQDKHDAFMVDKDLEQEAEEAQLMIDDPRAFERVQISKQMERHRENGKAHS